MATLPKLVRWAKSPTDQYVDPRWANRLVNWLNGAIAARSTLKTAAGDVLLDLADDLYTATALRIRGLGAAVGLTLQPGDDGAGTGARILGDFGAATLKARTLVQSATAGGGAVPAGLGVLPASGSAAAGVVAFGAADPTSAGYAALVADAAAGARVESGQAGGGAALPLALVVGGVTAAQASVAAGLPTTALSGRVTLPADPLVNDPPLSNAEASAFSQAKAWAHVTYSGGAPTLRASYNVGSLVDSGVGLLSVVWTRPFATAYYAAAVTLKMAAGAPLIARLVDQSTAHVQIRVETTAGVATDPEALAVAVFGTLG